jgi:hypothetical protein
MGNEHSILKSLKGLLALMMAVCLVLLLLIVRGKATKAPINFSYLVKAVISPTPEIVWPTATPVPVIKKAEFLTPDGAKALHFEEKTEAKTALYTILVADKTTEEKSLVLEKTLPVSSKLLVPYNTWSPDNTYFYLEERGVNGTEYHLYSTILSEALEKQESINISSLFRERLPEYSMEEITGWAAPDLLVVNAKLITDGSPQSFWFATYDHSFIPLANYFY